MISRTWHGIVPINNKYVFGAYLNETGVREAQAIEGNVAAYVHAVDQIEYTHFFLCTIWKTWEDVMLFAGDYPNIAVTYPEDEAYGLISDPIVIHQVVDTDNNPYIWESKGQFR